MLIAVASKNPVKLQAVKNAVSIVWPDKKFDFIAVEVEHGTSIQPNSAEEAIKGATLRAKLALKETNADYAFGLEGNTESVNESMFVSWWIAVLDKQGKLGLAGGNRTLLPDFVANQIKQGKELGPVMDELLNENNVKQKQGAVGALTNGFVSRTKGYELTAICALSKFLAGELYK